MDTDTESGASVRADHGGAWYRGYGLGVLRADVIAGVTLAAYMLPAAMGDASLANLPPEAGLYACLFAGLVFPWFCGSRRTTVTVTSAISLLIGTTLGPMAGGDAERFGALAACTALMVASLAAMAWLIRAGSLVTFVSETVLVGFKIGVALTLASTQMPKLLGIAGAHDGFWGNVRHLAASVPETHGTSFVVGIAALGVLVLGKMYLKHKPVALVVVVGAIVVSGAIGLEDRGVKMLGDVPRGLPAIGFPSVTRHDLNELLPLAMACFLLGAVETAAIGRMFARKHGERVDINRELLALAGANLAAGLGRGYPVSGGVSQSLVNESSGARTPMSGLVAAAIIAAVVVFFTDLLHDLPQPVLAAIILTAVAGLVNVRMLVRLWERDRTELLIVAAALVGVLASGLLRGVLIGAVISLLLLLRRASRPHVASLGRVPGTRRFSDIERHPENETVPGVCIVRPETGIVYFNADFVRDSVMERVRGSRERVQAVVCDLSSTPFTDLAGAEMIVKLEEELRAMGVRLQVVEARAVVRDRLRAEGLEESAGRIDRFTTVADAVDDAIAAQGQPRDV
ncbi:MAG: SulP family inorganic anion transporter [Phycisphaeraceae bacterium]|nr:SulP family inorganic anion transporter [Phycisphaeraceae bacterium]